jgi:hypothetical protein
MANSFLRAGNVIEERSGGYRGVPLAARLIQLAPRHQLLAAFALLPGVLLKGGNFPVQQSTLCPLQGSGKLQPKTTLPLESFNRECPLAHDSRQIVELVRQQLRSRL